jgi:hypothetical protein
MPVLGVPPVLLFWYQAYIQSSTFVPHALEVRRDVPTLHRHARK